MNPDFTGNSGSINITAGSLVLAGSSQISASTFGQGSAGNITLQVRDRIALDNSFIFNSVEQDAQGDGGNLSISANTLDLSNGARIIASTDGNGNAGNLTIDITDRIALSGSRDFFSSAIFSQVGPIARGNGGNVQITANALEMSDGASLNVSTRGSGNAGDITASIRPQTKTIDRSNTSSLPFTIAQDAKDAECRRDYDERNNRDHKRH